MLSNDYNQRTVIYKSVIFAMSSNSRGLYFNVQILKINEIKMKV